LIDFRKIWVIARSLLLSQLRSSSAGRGGSFRSLIRRPRILGILDLVVATVGSIAAYLIANAIHNSTFGDQIAPSIQNVIVILPAIILGSLLLLGLVLEVSSGAGFASSDTVNWLPVKAAEYVAASTLSLLMYYSVFPVAALSATFSLALVFGYSGAWLLGAFLSFFSIIVAASVLELLRAILNRFSSTFYKRGGRAAIGLRAISGIVVLILFQALFYPSVYEHFLGVITPQVGPTWFVPILWASVSVTTYIAGEFTTALLFGLLTVALAGALFYVAVGARSKYWVPMPPSITITSAVYAPRTGFASTILNVKELAIARKDLRGLVRRREMLRLLATPFVFLVISFLSSGSGGLGFTLYIGFFIVSISALIISMSEIGSEGKAIINLYLIPLRVKDFVIGKAVTPIVFSSLSAVLIYVLLAVVDRTVAFQALTFVFVAVGIALEMSLLGLFLGLRYPNFSEGPRSAFVSQTGALLGMAVAAIVGGISVAPLLIASILGLDSLYIAVGIAASIAFILVGSFVFYRLAEHQATKLLSQLPN
jgi:hypothetical protein